MQRGNREVGEHRGKGVGGGVPAPVSHTRPMAVLVLGRPQGWWWVFGVTAAVVASCCRGCSVPSASVGH